jgi:uncharacterized membrane protein
VRVRPLSKYLVAYVATAAVMIALDLLWIGVIAKPIYQQGIGHLMAERVNVGVAFFFYALFAAGIVVFGVAPNESAPGWMRTALMSGLFGLFAYATYDLTNLATLKNWPVGVSLIDMAWGTAVSAVSGVAGKTALDAFVAR